MGFFRTLAIVVLAFIVMRLARQLLRPGGPPADPRLDARGPEGADLVQDPACGVYVPRASAIQSHDGTETIWFCSETCREAHGRGVRARR